MPIQLKNGSNNPSPMVISQDEYAQGRTNFQQHYYLANCNSIFGGQDLTIQWASLNNAVNAFCTQYGLSASVVALRFVYCYDLAANNLYMRLQLCQMQQSTQGSNVYNLMPSPVAWYQLTDGSFVSTPVTILNDPSYLTNFFYSDTTTCDVATLQPLSSDQGQIYAQTITYPWENEIYQLYVDNQASPDFQISFGACSYVRQDSTTPCTWPHGLVMYMRTADGVPLLDDNNYISMFHNKGADFGTLCPSYCNVYIAPTVTSKSKADVSQKTSVE